MSKKNNKQQQAAVKAAENATNKTVETKAAPVVTPPVDKPTEEPVKVTTPVNTPTEKPVNKPKKEKKTPTTPPVGEPTGTIEEPVAEEVQKPDTSVAIPSVSSLTTMLQEGDIMDANHAAEFLSALERRTARMDRSKPLTIKMESMLDYNMLWYSIKLSVQSYAQKRDMNMLLPNDEGIVQEFIDMASSMGIALEAHPTTDPKQLELKFPVENIPEDVKTEAVQENVDSGVMKETPVVKKSRVLSPEEMDPKNWKNDEDAVKALLQDMREPNEHPSQKFLRCLNKIKTYHEALGKDIKDVTVGSLAEDYVRILGKKSGAVINGIMSSAISSLRLGQTMLFAHAMIKRNMPALQDTEVADLIRAFINIRHKLDNLSTPIDQDEAVVKGIIAPTRDLFVRISTLKPAESEDIDWFKKIYNPFYSVYKDEIGSRVDENGKENKYFALNMANKMIEIRNLYVDADSRFDAFTKPDFDALLIA